MAVKILFEETATKVSITAPYNSEYLAEAKRLGGTWENEKWNFDILQKREVRNAVMTHYGYDIFSGATDVVDVLLYPKFFVERFKGRSLTVFGVKVAYCGGLRVHQFVEFVGGGLSQLGHDLAPKPGTQFIMRDVPREKVEKTRLLGDAFPFMCEILNAPFVNREELEAERALLMKRLDEIDQLLKGE